MPPTGDLSPVPKKRKRKKKEEEKLKKGRGGEEDKTKEKREREEIKKKENPSLVREKGIVNGSRLWGSDVFTEVRVAGFHWKERKEVASNHPSKSSGLMLGGLLFGL